VEEVTMINQGHEFQSLQCLLLKFRHSCAPRIIASSNATTVMVVQRVVVCRRRQEVTQA